MDHWKDEGGLGNVRDDHPIGNGVVAVDEERGYVVKVFLGCKVASERREEIEGVGQGAF